MVSKLKMLAAAGALALAPVGIQAVAPAETPVAAASAQALNIYYKGYTRCVIGVHPVLSYTKWYRVYDYNWTEELQGYRDYQRWSHDGAPQYNVQYPTSRCNVWGYIVSIY